MIRADEIDPTLRKALAERIAKLEAQKTGLDPVAAQVVAAWKQTRSAVGKRYLYYYCLSFVSCLASGFLPAILYPENDDRIVAMFYGVNLLTLAFWLYARRGIRADMAQWVGAEMMEAAEYLVPLSRGERLYCEGVASLIHARSVLGEGPQKEILAQLNELLGSYRKLELASNHYRTVSASHPVAGIEHELARLAQKRDALDDPAARETVEHSIRLCEQRLEQARRFEPLHQRAEAQEELVLQTMAALHASLDRIRAAGTAPPATEMLGLRETVDEVTRQTRSVEEAVHEVMAFSGAGSGR